MGSVTLWQRLMGVMNQHSQVVLIPLSLSRNLQGSRGGRRGHESKLATMQEGGKKEKGSRHLGWSQKPDGVKTFISRGFSLWGRGETRLDSVSEISILGGMNLAGSSTFWLICVLVPSIVEDFCRPKQDCREKPGRMWQILINKQTIQV